MQATRNGHSNALFYIPTSNGWLHEVMTGVCGRQIGRRRGMNKKRFTVSPLFSVFNGDRQVVRRACKWARKRVHSPYSLQQSSVVWQSQDRRGGRGLARGPHE